MPFIVGFVNCGGSCVLAIILISDKSLGITKPSILSINDRQIEAQQRNLVLAYVSVP